MQEQSTFNFQPATDSSWQVELVVPKQLSKFKYTAILQGTEDDVVICAHLKESLSVVKESWFVICARDLILLNAGGGKWNSADQFRSDQTCQVIAEQQYVRI